MIKSMKIETNRLIIRPFIQSDIKECFKLMQNKELYKYLDWQVTSFEDFKGVFKWWIDLYETDYDGDFKYNFAIFLKDNNKFIGWGGFGVIDCFYPNNEIYYLIGKEYWGNGYATEAMNALIHYYFNTIGLQQIIALAKPENIASNRVIQKLGFKFERFVSGLPKEFYFYNGEPYYSLTKDEYLNIKKNILFIGCKDTYLREFRLEDLDKLYELTLQREITDFLPDWISSKEQRRQWLIEDVQENNEFLEFVPNASGQCLRLVIVLKETNEVIGWCCSGIKDELPPPNREIAYAISKEYRGKGYTTQAAQGLINYLFHKTNIEELNAIALLRNVPSNRVIEKCGFNYVGVVEIDKEKFNYYKINKKEEKIIAAKEEIQYRELSIDECDRMSEIDASQWIKKV